MDGQKKKIKAAPLYPEQNAPRYNAACPDRNARKFMAIVFARCM
jgi:hypothetical protein